MKTTAKKASTAKRKARKKTAKKAAKKIGKPDPKRVEAVLGNGRDDDGYGHEASLTARDHDSRALRQCPETRTAR